MRKYQQRKLLSVHSCSGKWDQLVPSLIFHLQVQENRRMLVRENLLNARGALGAELASAIKDTKLDLDHNTKSSFNLLTI